MPSVFSSFSLTNVIFPVVTKQRNGDPYAIYHGSGCGPVFGGGHDLILRDTDFQKSSDCYSQQSSYQLPIMNGAQNGRVDFSVEEYEVFQVTDK